MLDLRKVIKLNLHTAKTLRKLRLQNCMVGYSELRDFLTLRDRYFQSLSVEDVALMGRHIGKVGKLWGKFLVHVRQLGGVTEFKVKGTLIEAATEETARMYEGSGYVDEKDEYEAIEGRWNRLRKEIVEFVVGTREDLPPGLGHREESEGGDLVVYIGKSIPDFSDDESEDYGSERGTISDEESVSGDDD